MTVLFGRSEELPYGVGGLNADVMRFTVLQCDVGSDEKRHLVKINQDVFKFIQVHFAYCLSEIGCGIIRGVSEFLRHCLGYDGGHGRIFREEVGQALQQGLCSFL